MKKKIFLMLAVMAILVCVFAVSVSAKDVYLEEIPSELKDDGEAFTHFVVFEEEKYFTGSGSTINGLNTSLMEEDMESAGIDKSLIGTEYLTRFNFPAYLGTNLITYVNLNAIKFTTYFSGKCGYIQLAGTVTALHDMNQASGQLRCIDFGEKSQLTDIPFYFANNAVNLRLLKNFPQNLTTIDQYAFCYCKKLQGTLYINAVTVKYKAFDNAIVNIDGIIFGEDTVNIENQAFTTLEVAGSKSTKFIEFQGDVTKMNISASGTNQGAFYFASGTQRNPYSGLVCLVLSHPDNQSQITEGETTFQDFLPNVYFNTTSATAGDLVKKDHNNAYNNIVYQSFCEAGEKIGACSSCGHSGNSQEAPALFTYLGYSSPDDGRMGIVIGFAVDNEAITEYEAITGTTVKYGVFAVLKDKLGDNDVFAKDGALAEGAIAVEISNHKLSAFELKIVGVTDTQKDVKLAMGAFVKVVATDGETTASEYSYMQGGTPAEGDDYYFVSYNDIVNASTSTDTTVTE